MHADQILFVENGRILERGTHEELLALGGRYRALYDLQVRPGGDARRLRRRRWRPPNERAHGSGRRGPEGQAPA